MLNILGIDPGSTVTGFGLIRTDGVRHRCLAHRHLRLAAYPFNERLGRIHQQLGELLLEWQPDEVAIEQVFVSNNAMAALKLGQARGAAIACAVAAGFPVAEYTPRSVKQAVTGSGAADKQQVQVMIRHLLHLREPVQADAADGLAIALCHAQTRNWNGGLQQAVDAAEAAGASSAGAAATSRRGKARRNVRWTAAALPRTR